MALGWKFKSIILHYKTFDLVFKVVSTNFGTRSKVLIMVFLAFKTFDLMPKLVLTTFNQKKKNFWSSAIQFSDDFPYCGQNKEIVLSFIYFYKLAISQCKISIQPFQELLVIFQMILAARK